MWLLPQLLSVRINRGSYFGWELGLCRSFSFADSLQLFSIQVCFDFCNLPTNLFSLLFSSQNVQTKPKTQKNRDSLQWSESKTKICGRNEDLAKAFNFFRLKSSNQNDASMWVWFWFCLHFGYPVLAYFSLVFQVHVRNCCFVCFFETLVCY